MRLAAASLLLLTFGTPASAHRLDEYLQATTISLEKNRVQAQIRLTPGVAVAPFVMATIQGVIAIALLLWATLGRFGTAQPAPAAISSGRQGLLENIAQLVEFSGHQETMVKRYVLETLRDAGRQLHAPRGLSTAALIGWLQRVGAARGVETDCVALVGEAATLDDGRRHDPASLVRLARGIHRWKGEIINGLSRHPRDR